MFDTQSLINYGGILFVFLAIYGQTGLFFCFFIPSGAFMFSAGAMIAAGDLNDNILAVGMLLVLASILGNLTGYVFGRKAGSLLCNRQDSTFFRQEYLAKAERFYDKFGGRALSVGLFLPVIRTFAPIVAGIIGLKISRFIFFVTIGSVCWIFSFLLAGYAVGSRPFFRPYLKYIVAGIVIVVSIPVIIKIIKILRKDEADRIFQ